MKMGKKPKKTKPKQNHYGKDLIITMEKSWHQAIPDSISGLPES
jgi:hypothetical protein